MNVSQYLDKEFEGIDVSLEQEELFEKLNPGSFAIFENLVENICALWSSNYASVEDIMDAEFKAHDFIYKNPELSKICLAIHRDREEKTLDYVMNNISKPESILDLGCGEGIKSIYYAIATGANITAVDIIPSGLNLVKEKARQYGLNNISTMELDIRDFDLGHCFDGVFANCVLHESGDNRGGEIYGPPNRIADKVKNIAKHLNPGGIFIATLNERYDSDGMSCRVARHAENQGLQDINMEIILEGEYSNLIAIKAKKIS
jgi:SAM-dependent methyltransferase